MAKSIRSFQVIFILGLILQSLLPMERVFNFDQDQVALNTLMITQGDLTALGPQTSNMDFFTGPLIYYLAAPFFFLTGGHPLALALTAIFIYAGNFWLIYFCFRRRFKETMVKAFLTIFSLSPLLVQFNRITWNPLFSFLAGSLVLAGLLKNNYWSVGLGMFFAYQASFSGFVMVVALGLYGLWQRSRKLVLSGYIGFFISLLPLIYFDIRHDWINFNGLIDFALQTGNASGLAWLKNIGAVSVIYFENFTKLLAGYFFPRLVLVVFGMIAFGYWLRLKRSYFTGPEKQKLVFWLIIFPLAALFYTDGLPEYYFLMQLPALVFIVADLVIGLKLNQARLYGFMAVVSLGVILDQISGYNLKDKYQAMQFIHERLDGRAVELHFDMDYKEQFGWNYWLRYFQVETVPQGPRAHIIYPVNSTTNYTRRFGNIGVYLNY